MRQKFDENEHISSGFWHVYKMRELGGGGYIILTYRLTRPSFHSYRYKLYPRGIVQLFFWFTSSFRRTWNRVIGDMYSRFDSDICANSTNTVIRFLTTIHLERVRHLLPRHFGYECAVILLLVPRLLISLRDELMYPVSIVFTYSTTFVFGVHKCFPKKRTERPMLWTRGHSRDPGFEIKGPYCCWIVINYTTLCENTIKYCYF